MIYGSAHGYEDQAEEDLTLPTRTLSREANLDEYRKETASGATGRVLWLDLFGLSLGFAGFA